MNFGRSLPNLAFKALRPLRLLASDEGQGFLKLLGGLPTWCAGGFGDLGTKDAIGSTEIIVARRLLNAMLLGRLVHEVYDRFGEADSLVKLLQEECDFQGSQATQTRERGMNGIRVSACSLT
jgi:hypothetical protein